ncbi:MAG: glutamine--fructose-6-phosphate transaminase (isomerizing) [Ruminococcus sp.]|jgi:glucosamine--fructose-6-phosphate aminotransferase (isomerizing)|nr:glutamine--fructose-6-phosphate transaminase (isomerizing) [Ruminococcus sp.]
MCGIVGYVGNKKKNSLDVLIDGLKKLEYRGYDSAGVAVFADGKIKTVKSEGRLLNLEEKLDTEYSDLHSDCGIGHTRWATHGEPSDINAHPHSGGRVAIVHNGIIENYRELKEYLISRGKRFISETDTEVVAQLLDFYYNGNPVDAIVKTCNDLKGSFALGIIFKDFEDTIFAVRRESPLIVGVGDGESYIASDVPAILKYTKQYYLLEGNEIAVLSPYGAKIYDMHYRKINKELKIADFDIEAAEKQGYEHFMLKEINEQPDAIKTTIKPLIENGLPLFENIDFVKYKKIFIVACGTAYYAGIVGKYIIEKLARVPVEVDIASEFRYRDPIAGEGDLVVIISQSGETADSLASLRIAKKLGAETLAIVNVKGSSIARESDLLIYTHAGPEIAVASTKAYIVQISVMYMIAFEMSLKLGKISEDKCKEYINLLLKCPDIISEMLKDNKAVQYVANKLINSESLFYIGRGLDYALSLEGSLKLKEISYIHSESYGAGELKHGPISLITSHMPVIAIATQSDLFDKTVSNIKEVKARGAKVTVICKKGTKLADDVYDNAVFIPDIGDDILNPLLTVIPLQLIAYYTSVLRGNDVDKPRNLAKSVTVE